MWNQSGVSYFSLILFFFFSPLFFLYSSHLGFFFAGNVCPVSSPISITRMLFYVGRLVKSIYFEYGVVNLTGSFSLYT